MRIFITLLALIGAFAFLSSDTTAGDDRDRGVGRVVGIAVHGDHPVAGATIVLKHARTDRKLRTRTDDRGRFEFDRVPAGRWIVVGRHDRAGSGRARVAVQPRQTSRVRLELTRR